MWTIEPRPARWYRSWLAQQPARLIDCAMAEDSFADEFRRSL